MKKITLLILVLAFSGMSAQVTNQGEPLSWKRSYLQNVMPVVMEEINMQALMEEDVVNDWRKDIPWRFGKELEVNLNTENSGIWDVIENGDRIWRINIQSNGAKTLNFVFGDFYLPEGASLYLYSDDRTDLIGAYTSDQNRTDRQLGTWFVDGGNVWLEYYEPHSQRDKGSLQIAKVVHGYRSVAQHIEQKALNNSAMCHYDVNCSVGADFDDAKDVLKRAVGLFVLGGSVCSGTLINNTKNDNAPYFLTAAHCDYGNPATWAFRFNWISPDPSCATTANSTNSNYNQTASGATLLAKNPKSDFMLLHIDANLPPSWNLVWAGWNRSTTEVPDFTVGIHHPAGDIMKICRGDQPPVRATIDFQVQNVEVWRVNAWDIGVTEGGSSGSALFDQEGRIVGQLAGGAAACEGYGNNGQPDFYGRFETSWDYGTTSSTRLSNWLDPDATGAVTTDRLSSLEFRYIGNISVYPNPANSVIYIMNNNSSQLSFEVYAVTGQLIKTGKLPFENNTVAVDDFAEGVYFFKLFDGVTNNALVKKLIVKR